MAQRDAVKQAVNQIVCTVAEEAMNAARLHQQENGRWEWLKLIE